MSAVHISAIANLDDSDCFGGIDDFVQDTIVALANAAQLDALEFLGTGRSWLRGKCLHAPDDSTAVLLRKRLEFFDGRRLDQQPIFCHGAVSPSGLSRDRRWAPSNEHGRRRDRRRLRQG